MAIDLKVASLSRPLLGYASDKERLPYQLAKNVWIGENTVIEGDCLIGDNTIVDHFSYVGYGAKIGRSCLLTYRAWVSERCKIGNNCVIGGFIGESTLIGDRCRVFGSIVHHHIRPYLDWDAPTSQEEPAVLEDDVFVGFGATIAANIRIGSGSYVCANAIVSKDVPAGMVACFTNKIVPIADWPGSLSKALMARSRKK